MWNFNNFMGTNFNTNFMTTIFFIMLSAFFGYVGYIAVRYGIQPSVSESYYRLPRNFQWVFTIATWGYAIPAMIIGLDFTGNGIVFLAGVGIAFVGASPAFHKLGMERTVHTVGAVVGITAMQLFLCIVGFWWITLTFGIISGLLFIWKKTYSHFIWWVEIAAFISISLYYLIKLYL